VSRSEEGPDPPSRCHLRRCLRSLLPAAYSSYASVVVPRCLASNTFLVTRDRPKSYVFVDDSEFSWWIWEGSIAKVV